MVATIAWFVWQGVIRTEKLDSDSNVAMLCSVLLIVSGHITPLLTSVYKFEWHFLGAYHLHKMLFWLDTNIFYLIILIFIQ